MECRSGSARCKMQHATYNIQRYESAGLAKSGVDSSIGDADQAPIRRSRILWVEPHHPAGGGLEAAAHGKNVYRGCTAFEWEARPATAENPKTQHTGVQRSTEITKCTDFTSLKGAADRQSPEKNAYSIMNCKMVLQHCNTVHCVATCCTRKGAAGTGRKRPLPSAPAVVAAVPHCL